MSSVMFAEGKTQEYLAEISFNLNLENKKSSKVKKGDKIFYDGHIASYTSSTGINISGESRSLRSAIQSGWIVLIKNGTKVVPTMEVPKIKNKEDFDNKKGGNFDSFVKNESNVIQEKDLIVKEMAPIKKGLEKAQSTGEKLEISGDQVSVKKVGEPLMVSSSTTVARTKTHSKVIQESNSFGADNTRPLNMKKSSGVPEVRKKKAFTVDATTPAVHEEATLEEVTRAKGTEPMDDQGATVVKKIKQGSMQVETMEGVTLKKTESPKDMTVKTKVSSGGESAVDIQTSADTVIVGAKKEYSSMLPEDWKSMHWVKKEKWIKSQTDPKLLEYILSVEDVNAVINACKERLKEFAEG